jgi:hypothetical protein
MPFAEGRALAFQELAETAAIDHESPSKFAVMQINDGTPAVVTEAARSCGASAAVTVSATAAAYPPPGVS